MAVRDKLDGRSPQGSSHQEDQDNQELSRQRGGAAGTPSSEADRTQFLSLQEVEAGATVRAHTQQNPPGCHEGVGSNGPIGLPPYEVLRLGLPANTGGLRGARAGPSSLRVTNGKGKGVCLNENPIQIQQKAHNHHSAWLTTSARRAFS